MFYCFSFCFLEGEIDFVAQFVRKMNGTMYKTYCFDPNLSISHLAQPGPGTADAAYCTLSSFSGMLLKIKGDNRGGIMPIAGIRPRNIITRSSPEEHWTAATCGICP